MGTRAAGRDDVWVPTNPIPRPEVRAHHRDLGSRSRCFGSRGSPTIDAPCSLLLWLRNNRTAPRSAHVQGVTTRAVARRAAPTFLATRPALAVTSSSSLAGFLATTAH